MWSIRTGLTSRMVTNMADKFATMEEFRDHKRQKHAEMEQKQRLPYSIKVRMAANRIRSWIEIAQSEGYGCHVSVGGLDSITLLAFIRSLGHDAEEVPAISASGLEDRSIQAVHKEMGVEIVKPLLEQRDKETKRSAPFSFFYHSDVVHLAVDLGVHIPEIYGEVKTRENKDIPDGVEYYTTGEQRTGCSMCGFGVQLEKRPHRFDRLYLRNPKEWEFWMEKCCKDPDGTPYGWGRVLDYVGIGWRNPDIFVQYDKEQISVFEILEGGNNGKFT